MSCRHKPRNKPQQGNKGHNVKSFLLLTTEWRGVPSVIPSPPRSPLQHEAVKGRHLTSFSFYLIKLNLLRLQSKLKILINNLIILP